MGGAALHKMTMSTVMTSVCTIMSDKVIIKARILKLIGKMQSNTINHLLSRHLARTPSRRRVSQSSTSQRHRTSASVTADRRDEDAWMRMRAWVGGDVSVGCGGRGGYGVSEFLSVVFVRPCVLAVVHRSFLGP